jgi:hypothetical protein
LFVYDEWFRYIQIIFHCFPNKLSFWLIDWLFDWLIDWLIESINQNHNLLGKQWKCICMLLLAFIKILYYTMKAVIWTKLKLRFIRNSVQTVFRVSSTRTWEPRSSNLWCILNQVEIKSSTYNVWNQRPNLLRTKHKLEIYNEIRIHLR